MALVQASYFAASGLWPLVDMRSFEAVLGEKREDWLVRTVALFVLAIAGTLGVAAIHRDVDTNIKTLGVLGAAAPGIASAVGVASGRVSRLYAIDAVIELALIVAWSRAAIRNRTGYRLA